MVILVISSIFSIFYGITTQTKNYFKKFLVFCLLVVMSFKPKHTHNFINLGILLALYALLIGLYGHIYALECVGFGPYDVLKSGKVIQVKQCFNIIGLGNDLQSSIVMESIQTKCINFDITCSSINYTTDNISNIMCLSML